MNERDLDVLKYIINYKAMYGGNSPTLREIISGTNETSTSVVRYRIRKLEQAGMLNIHRRANYIITPRGNEFYGGNHV